MKPKLAEALARVSDFYTTAEAAVALGVSVQTIHNLVKREELSSKHAIGRTLFLRSEVEALAKKRSRAQEQATESETRAHVRALAAKRARRA